MARLVLDIEPKPQTRPRFTKYGRTYEDPAMKRWRKHVTGLIQKYYDDEYFESAISVEVTFYMKAPQSIAKKPTPKAKPQTWLRFKDYVSELIWHIKKPDLDNLIKAVFDSMSDSGVIWKDDNQVCDLKARKLYSPKPRIELEIKKIIEKEYMIDDK